MNATQVYINDGVISDLVDDYYMYRGGKLSAILNGRIERLAIKQIVSKHFVNVRLELNLLNNDNATREVMTDEWSSHGRYAQ